MFVIRESQVSALGDDGRRRFVERMAGMVARDFPHVCQGEDATALPAWVRTRCADARAAGLETSSDLRAWIQLAATHGEDFVEKPWAAPVLSDSALRPDEKLRALEERAVFVEIAS